MVTLLRYRYDVSVQASHVEFVLMHITSQPEWLGSSTQHGGDRIGPPAGNFGHVANIQKMILTRYHFLLVATDLL